MNNKPFLIGALALYIVAVYFFFIQVKTVSAPWAWIGVIGVLIGFLSYFVWSLDMLPDSSMAIGLIDDILASFLLVPVVYHIVSLFTADILLRLYIALGVAALLSLADITYGIIVALGARKRRKRR